MTTDTLKERATTRARRSAGEKGTAKPNYILLGLGIVLVFAQILAAGERIHSLMTNTALLAPLPTRGSKIPRIASTTCCGKTASTAAKNATRKSGVFWRA